MVHQARAVRGIKHVDGAHLRKVVVLLPVIERAECDCAVESGFEALLLVPAGCSLKRFSAPPLPERHLRHRCSSLPDPGRPGIAVAAHPNLRRQQSARGTIRHGNARTAPGQCLCTLLRDRARPPAKSGIVSDAGVGAPADAWRSRKLSKARLRARSRRDGCHLARWSRPFPPRSRSSIPARTEFQWGQARSRPCR